MKRVIAVCTGHRCAALLPRSAPDWPDLRAAVRTSEQVVLVSTGCVGACAQAPVVAVACPVHVQPHAGGHVQIDVPPGCTTWLGPVGHEQVQALCVWLRGRDLDTLPLTLDQSVFATGPH